MINITQVKICQHIQKHRISFLKKLDFQDRKQMEEAVVFQLSANAEREWGHTAEAVQGEEQSSLERYTGCGQVRGGCSRQGRKQQKVWGAAKAFLSATDISQTKRWLQHHGSSLCR